MKIVKNNVIHKKANRLFQSETLRETAESILPSGGPMGSDTRVILHLAQDPNSPNRQMPVVKYTKDGHSILSYLRHCDNGMLCNSIVNDVYDLTSYVKKKVGDNSTGAAYMASTVFDNLVKVEEETKLPPREIVKQFKKAVDLITEEIRMHTQEFTSDEAYNIAYISSNGNETVASNIKQIYDDYGKDVYIDIDISDDETDKMKILDGMAINTGYNSPTYRNDIEKNTASIQNPRIYYFRNNIDTPDQINLFASIIIKNIIDPYKFNKLQDVKPTVILAPQLANDAIVELNEIIRYMQSYDKPELIKNKPPLLVITGIFEDEATDDIARLCGCPPIRKYQNLEKQKDDREAGKAPTPETIADGVDGVVWYGTSELVVADPTTTKFINPKLKYSTKGDERKLLCTQTNQKFVPSDDDDEQVLSSHYNALISGLESELAIQKNNNATIDITGRLIRRINSLKSRVVVYQVGGISVTARDSRKDLIWDAIRNCRSASSAGVGLACNMEGFLTCKDILGWSSIKETQKRFITMVHDSYVQYISRLYQLSFGIDEAESIKLLNSNTREDGIIDIAEGYEDSIATYSNRIKSTIDADIVTLEAISNIVTLMMNSAQTIIPEPLLDTYTAFAENIQKQKASEVPDKADHTCKYN